MDNNQIMYITKNDKGEPVVMYDKQMSKMDVLHKFLLGTKKDGSPRALFDIFDTLDKRSVKKEKMKLKSKKKDKKKKKKDDFNPFLSPELAEFKSKKKKKSKKNKKKKSKNTVDKILDGILK